MPGSLLIAIGVLFVAVAVIAGLVTSYVLARSTPERRRLRDLALAGPAGGSVGELRLTDAPGEITKRLATFVPKSPKEMSRLRRRLTRAGYPQEQSAAIYSAAEVLLPVLVGLAGFFYVGINRGLILVVLGVVIAYTLPGFWVAYRTRQRQKQIQNGLPDALDLLIVCVEAGSSLDQAIVKASDELAIAYPALATELRLIITEIRAGKPRLEAFKNFADRTGVEDVRTLVAMMVQTDRFGTSIAQALRTAANVSRTKRRQRAEERAAKLSVKLVFPLVFCLFPAMYVVTLGPAVIKIFRVLLSGQ
jgi:tight adherence protein C